MSTYDNEFKEQAVAYVHNHPELSKRQCADHLGVNPNTLHTWLSKARKNEAFRGSGNY